jgi:glucose-1-phosphate thymidylyltransferase
MEIVKALVLAGRSHDDKPWPSVRSLPKALVPVANRPILFHALEALARAGVQQATIVADPHTAAVLRDAVGDGDRFAVDVRHAVCETGAGLRAILTENETFVGGDPVVVQHAGALLRNRIPAHMAAFAADELDALAMRLHPPVGAARAFAPADGGWLLSNRAVGMVCEAPAGADPIAAVRRHGGHVSVEDAEGWLLGEGAQDTLLQANRLVLQDLVASVDPASLDGTELQGPVVVHPTARLRNSLVRGPAIIGPRTELINAYVGPYSSIGADVTIEGAQIEHSIVFAGAELRFVGTRIETSVIGRGARVVRRFDVSDALRLSVGDRAEIVVG